MLRYELKEDEINKSLYLRLQCPYLDINMSPEIRDIYSRFTVKTYDNFKTIDVIKNGTVFRPVNDFFATLPMEEQTLIAQTLISMNAIIHLTFHNDNSTITVKQLETDLGVLTTKLGHCLNSLDTQIDLFRKIDKFVREVVPIYREDNLGSRAQDSDEMTFTNEEITTLTTLVVLCKILSPVYGQLIDRIKDILDTSTKELHCSLILTPIIKRHMQDLKIKLDNYLYNTIKPKATIDRVYHMQNENMNVSIVQAMIFVRRFISMNIYDPNSKLMVYIHFCARSASNTQQTNATKKMSVRERQPPFEVFGDDGNISKLENDSQFSRTSMDNPFIIKNNADMFIHHLILELGLDKELIDLMVLDYINKPLPITDMNKYLLCIAFGKQLEGPKSINHLYRNEYMQLLSILQIKLLYTNMAALIPLLSLIPSAVEKQHMTARENEIRIYWPQSPEYRLCKEKFGISVDKKMWDNKLKEIIELITMNTYYQYFPQSFLDIMTEPFESNVPYKLELETISLICKFIYESV
jgi:hypothetical protein